jgi:hypothetical protein
MAAADLGGAAMAAPVVGNDAIMRVVMIHLMVRCLTRTISLSIHAEERSSGSRQRESHDAHKSGGVDVQFLHRRTRLNRVSRGADKAPKRPGTFQPEPTSP